MRASRLLERLEKMGIHTITGVPDSTLKQFCDGVQNYTGNLQHYVTANEGAAVDYQGVEKLESLDDVYRTKTGRRTQ